MSSIAAKFKEESSALLKQADEGDITDEKLSENLEELLHTFAQNLREAYSPNHPKRYCIHVFERLYGMEYLTGGYEGVEDAYREFFDTEKPAA